MEKDSITDICKTICFLGFLVLVGTLCLKISLWFFALLFCWQAKFSDERKTTVKKV